MPEWLEPLANEIGLVSTLAIFGIIGLWRMERTDRKEAESREREATKSFAATIDTLARAIEGRGPRNG